MTKRREMVKLMGTLEPDRGAEGAPCRNCKKRPATVRWIGEGGSLAFIHGMYDWWCEICATEAQLAYAREQACSVPELERKLAKLREADDGRPA